MIDDINIYGRLQKHSSWLVRREREPFARFVFIRPPILSLISTRPPHDHPTTTKIFTFFLHIYHYLYRPNKFHKRNILDIYTSVNILTGDFPEHFNCTSCHEMLQMLQNPKALHLRSPKGKVCMFQTFAKPLMRLSLFSIRLNQSSGIDGKTVNLLSIEFAAKICF